MQRVTDFERAIKRKYPEGVAIVIARDARGTHNPITLCWFMRVSFDPPLLAFAVGRERYSLGAIRQAREFVLSLPATGMAADALFHGTKSGREMDKLTAAGTRTQPAQAIDSVLLTDAVANFECRLESELPAGDHVIFVGRVVTAHEHADPAVRGLYAWADDKLGGAVPG